MRQISYGAMLSDDQINEFQRIYKKVLGKNINRKEAFEKGAALVRLMESIYKPVTKQDYKKTKKGVRKEQRERREKRAKSKKHKK